MRRVAAELRGLLLARAAGRLGADAASLQVTDGVVRAPGGKTVRYADLVDDALLAREATASVEPKAPDRRTIIGTRVPRRDLANKVNGAPAYIQDIVLEGMVHGRVIRPPSPAARLVAVDEDQLRKQPGVIAVVRDGSFLAVVAGTEIAAIRAQRAARRLSTWEETATLPATVDPRYLFDEKSEAYVAVDTSAGGSPRTARSVPHARSRSSRTADTRSGRTPRGSIRSVERSRRSSAPRAAMSA